MKKKKKKKVKKLRALPLSHCWVLLRVATRWNRSTTVQAQSCQPQSIQPKLNAVILEEGDNFFPSLQIGNTEVSSVTFFCSAVVFHPWPLDSFSYILVSQNGSFALETNNTLPSWSMTSRSTFGNRRISNPWRLKTGVLPSLYGISSFAKAARTSSSMLKLGFRATWYFWE